jgi:hypothetical protein
MRPVQLERRLRDRLDALGPAPRAELLHVLRLPDLERPSTTRYVIEHRRVTTGHGRRTEPRRVEDVLSGTQVAGTGRLPYLMEGESARAVEGGQPGQTGAAPKAERLVVATTP